MATTIQSNWTSKNTVWKCQQRRDKTRCLRQLITLVGAVRGGTQVTQLGHNRRTRDRLAGTLHAARRPEIILQLFYSHRHTDTVVKPWPRGSTRREAHHFPTRTDNSDRGTVKRRRSAGFRTYSVTLWETLRRSALDRWITERFLPRSWETFTLPNNHHLKHFAPECTCTRGINKWLAWRIIKTGCRKTREYRRRSFAAYIFCGKTP